MDSDKSSLGQAKKLMCEFFALCDKNVIDEAASVWDGARSQLDNWLSAHTPDGTRHGLDHNKLYGEGCNFGIISHVILENAARHCSNAMMCRKIGNICRYIKSNKLLSEQFAYYHALCSTNSVKRHTDKFVDHVVGAHHFNRTQVLAENAKLVEMIRNSGLDELIDIPVEREKLYESAEFLMYNHGTSRFDEAIDHRMRLSENLKKQGEEAEMEETCAADLGTKADEYDNAVAKLTPTEREMFNILIGDDQDAKKAKYDELKQVTLQRLRAAMDNADGEDCRQSYQSFISQVEGMEYDGSKLASANNCLDDICKFMSIVEVVDCDNGK